MRLRITACALTLLVGLGIVGLVSAEESGNWFTRMLPWSSGKGDPAKTPAVRNDMPPVQSSYAKRARRAKADLDRRQEVCIKLRDAAVTSGDDEMLQKIHLLEVRAFELYQAACNAPSETERVSVETNPKKGGR